MDIKFSSVSIHLRHIIADEEVVCVLCHRSQCALLSSLPWVSPYLHKVKIFWTGHGHIGLPTVAVIYVTGSWQLSLKMNDLQSLCLCSVLYMWTYNYLHFFIPFCVCVYFKTIGGPPQKSYIIIWYGWQK